MYLRGSTFISMLGSILKVPVAFRHSNTASHDPELDATLHS